MDIIESKWGDIVLTTCPHCGSSNSDDMQILFAAYRDNASLTCVDCGKEFFIELSCQTRAAEQQRAPVQSEHKCPRCNGRKLVRSTNNSDVKCPMCNGAGIY